MQPVNVHEAKTHFSKLLERVALGEEVVIARAGHPIAKLVPIVPRSPSALRAAPAGTCRSATTSTPRSPPTRRPRSSEAPAGTHALLPLPIHVRHALGLAALPDVHRDPFDRILVAQAIAEDLTLVSGDEMLRRYPAAVEW